MLEIYGTKEQYQNKSRNILFIYSPVMPIGFIDEADSLIIVLLILI
jgi:hypothetical protein